jgi:hypothetical protein
MKVNNIIVDLKDMGSDTYSFSVLATITDKKRKNQYSWKHYH